MTNPMGRSFLSYRRIRKAEAELLIAAQHDLGIPTWHDVADLAEVPTVEELRRVLEDPQTANAILWLTPEVEESDYIQKIEAPCILERAGKDDLFFVLPVAAGGLNYETAPSVLDSRFTSDDLRRWNLRKAEGDPIDAAVAAKIATQVLKRRLEKIHSSLPAEAPLRLSLYTREQAPVDPTTALTLDWSARFHGFENRETEVENWRRFFFPSLDQIAKCISRKAHGRRIEVQGLAGLPACAALGRAFMAPRLPSIAWQQGRYGGFNQLWSLNATREDSGFRSRTKKDNDRAVDLAVLVSVADNVKGAFTSSRPDLPAFRAISSVTKRGKPRHHIGTPGAAKDIAERTIEEIRNARSAYPEIRCIHLFMAVPTGIAMMIGQLVNTLPPIQTHELLLTDSGYRYRPAARLNESR